MADFFFPNDVTTSEERRKVIELIEDEFGDATSKLGGFVHGKTELIYQSDWEDRNDRK